MEQLNSYELLTLIKFWSTSFTPTEQRADRLLQLAAALKIRTAAEAAEVAK